MQRFEVAITGKDLERAQQTLPAGIDTAMAPTRRLGWLGELLGLGHRMTVRLTQTPPRKQKIA
jgi:hypothetical protein